MAYCRHCGEALSEGQTYCGRCGGRSRSVQDAAPLPVGVPVSRASTSIAGAAAAEASSGIARTLTTVLIVAAVVVGGGFFYSQYVAERPSDVVEKFIQAADAIDVNRMIECMPPEYERAWAATGKVTAAFIGIDPRDVFEFVPALLPGMAQMTGEDFEYGIELVEVLDERVSGDDAVVVVRLKMTTTDTDGRVSTEVEDSVAYLHKYSEGWRLVDAPVQQ